MHILYKAELSFYPLGNHENKLRNLRNKIIRDRHPVSRERSERTLPPPEDQKVTYFKFSLKRNTFAFEMGKRDQARRGLSNPMLKHQQSLTL